MQLVKQYASRMVLLVLIGAGLLCSPQSTLQAAKGGGAATAGHVYTASGAGTDVTGLQALTPALSLPAGDYVVFGVAKVQQLGTAFIAPGTHGDANVALVMADSAHPTGQIIDTTHFGTPTFTDVATGNILRNDVAFHTVLTIPASGALLYMQGQNPTTNLFAEVMTVTWRLTTIVANGIN